MRIYSELTGKTYATVKECKEDEEKHAQEEKEKNDRAIQLRHEMVEANNKLIAARKNNEKAKQQAREIYEKSQVEISELIEKYNEEIAKILDPAREALSEAAEKKDACVKAYTKALAELERKPARVKDEIPEYINRIISSWFDV